MVSVVSGVAVPSSIIESPLFTLDGIPRNTNSVVSITTRFSDSTNLILICFSAPTESDIENSARPTSAFSEISDDIKKLPLSSV